MPCQSKIGCLPYQVQEICKQPQGKMEGGCGILSMVCQHAPLGATCCRDHGDYAGNDLHRYVVRGKDTRILG